MCTYLEMFFVFVIVSFDCQQLVNFVLKSMNLSIMCILNMICQNEQNVVSVEYSQRLPAPLCVVSNLPVTFDL